MITKSDETPGICRENLLGRGRVKRRQMDVANHERESSIDARNLSIRATRSTQPPSTCRWCPFPGAPFRMNEADAKHCTLLDLCVNIPSSIQITDGKLHEVNILGQLIPNAGSECSHRSRLHRLRASVSPTLSLQLLCHPGKEDHGRGAVLLSSRGPLRWRNRRPDVGTARQSVPHGLSRELPWLTLSGPGDRQALAVHREACTKSYGVLDPKLLEISLPKLPCIWLVRLSRGPQNGSQTAIR